MMYWFVVNTTGGKNIFKAHIMNGEYHAALLKMSQYFFAILTQHANLELVSSLT
jgi:hypothetical protein